jgi:hypothetical protein
MRHFGKRGMDDKLAFIMWEIIVIFMVVIALTLAVKGIANNTNYWKKYHSTDLALMTDLMLINQGDFQINYDMKELKSNVVTKTLGINNLVFETVLTKDAYFLYDESKENDRFPQSFIFGKTDIIKIAEYQTKNSYIILNKIGDSFSLSTNDASKQISCPAIDTFETIEDFLAKKITITGSDTLNEYIIEVNNKLMTNSQTNQELVIILVENKNNKSRIYYPTKSEYLIKSQKMSCLIYRESLKKIDGLDIHYLAYDNSLDLTPYQNEILNNNYWIIIELQKDAFPKEIFSEIIVNTINEYYGQEK